MNIYVLFILHVQQSQQFNAVKQDSRTVQGQQMTPSGE